MGIEEIKGIYGKEGMSIKEYKDFKGIKRKTPEKGPYVKIEEIENNPDVDPYEELIDRIDNPKESVDEGGNHSESGKKELSSKEQSEKQKIVEEKRKEIIGFMQNNKFVAHVGPGYSENEADKELIDEKDGHIIFPKFLSKAQFLRKIMAGFSSKYRKKERNTGREKDNLKTFFNRKGSEERMKRGYKEVIK